MLLHEEQDLGTEAIENGALARLGVWYGPPCPA
jgi:hypothetical protein